MRNVIAQADRSCGASIPRLTQEAKEDPAAVSRLASRLSHPNLMTRTKSARLLGELGDPAAIPHLQEALRRSYTQRSPLLHSIWGWLLTAVILIGCAALFLFLTCLCQGAPITDIRHYSEFGPWLVGLRRGQDPFVRACITSLAQVAERNSSPESGAIVPFLRGVWADTLHHSGETRATARLAVERIEASTAQIKHIPLPASAPEIQATELPIAVVRHRSQTILEQRSS